MVCVSTKCCLTLWMHIFKHPPSEGKEAVGKEHICSEQLGEKVCVVVKIGKKNRGPLKKVKDKLQQTRSLVEDSQTRHGNTFTWRVKLFSPGKLLLRPPVGTQLSRQRHTEAAKLTPDSRFHCAARFYTWETCLSNEPNLAFSWFKAPNHQN